ncbi:hypothetical protein E2C01_008264 [Portunus trituberculatus]|uniref:Uncharacterized protein n=1 Tax=Portunus trituberculatus TaxID=210409 RepID=A0A5B7D2N7_PORTR|nr:hypothetical protein [Portunus trituberculatus]
MEEVREATAAPTRPTCPYLTHLSPNRYKSSCSSTTHASRYTISITYLEPVFDALIVRAEIRGVDGGVLAREGTGIGEVISEGIGFREQWLSWLGVCGVVVTTTTTTTSSIPTTLKEGIGTIPSIRSPFIQFLGAQGSRDGVGWDTMWGQSCSFLSHLMRIFFRWQVRLESNIFSVEVNEDKGTQDEKRDDTIRTEHNRSP